MGGNARCAIICTVTPASAFVDETHSTLKFASRAKTICNKPEVNEVISDEALLKRYKREINVLKKQLDDIKDKDSQKEIIELDTLRKQAEQSNEELQRLLEKQNEEKTALAEKMEKLKNVLLNTVNLNVDTAPPRKKSRSTRRMTWNIGVVNGPLYKSDGMEEDEETDDVENVQESKTAVNANVDDDDDDEDEISFRRKSSDGVMDVDKTSSVAASATTTTSRKRKLAFLEDAHVQYLRNQVKEVRIIVFFHIQVTMIATNALVYTQLASEKEKYLKTLEELSQERKDIFAKLQTLCDKDSVVKLSGLPQEIQVSLNSLSLRHLLFANQPSIFKQSVQVFIEELLDNLAGMERSMFGYKEQAEFLELESQAQMSATEQMQTVRIANFNHNVLI